MPLDLLAGLKVIVSPLASVLGRWRRIRVRVHVAYLPSDPNAKAFINVVNLSSRDVEVVRVWFATNPLVDVINPARPLPRRLQPDESWETWLDLRALPTRKVDDLARVRLSSGKTVESAATGDIASAGVVPGP